MRFSLIAILAVLVVLVCAQTDAPDNHRPPQLTSGEGKWCEHRGVTCEECFGDVFEKCAATTCYNPTIGQRCCKSNGVICMTQGNTTDTECCELTFRPEEPPNNATTVEDAAAVRRVDAAFALAIAALVGTSLL